MKYVAAAMALLAIGGLYLSMNDAPVAALQEDEDELAFLDFVVKYAKHYADSDTLRFRFDRFKTNLA